MKERSSNIWEKQRVKSKAKTNCFSAFSSFLLDQNVLEGLTIVGGIINISYDSHSCHEKLFCQNVR